MSLPAYLFLYDENGTLVPGECEAFGREGSTEVLSSQFGAFLGVDSQTGRLTGRRQHEPFKFRKKIDRLTPVLFNAVCNEIRLKKVEIKYYIIASAGIEVESFRITLEDVVVCSFNFGHSYSPGSHYDNMDEIIGLRSFKITVLNLMGNVSYSDSWYRETEKEAHQ